MNNINIIPATLSHVQELALTMNTEDRDEYESVGRTAHKVLWRSWKNSMFRSTALVDGEVAACWGVSGSMLGLVGVPWLCTGRKAREISPLVFSRIYRTEARKMFDAYPVLENWCDNRYVGAIRMLKIAGFSLDEPQEFGKLKRMFRRFWRVA